MRTKASRTVAASLMFLAASCGPRPESAPPPEVEGPAPAVVPSTGRLTLHVKGMTKALNLT
jgi:hypothetical protein